MALLASLREVRRYMVGIGSSLEILQVTGDASGGTQVVVVIDVAIGALPRRNSVHSGERKPGAVVVELRVCPVAGAMALLASLREVRSHVVRIGSALEILQVTGDASGAA